MSNITAVHDQLKNLMKAALAHDAGHDVATLIERLAQAQDGAKNGSAVAVKEYGAGPFHFTKLTLTSLEIALTDEAGTVAHGGVKIYDFPAGAILILGAVADLDVTKDAAGVNDDWDGDFGLGTVVASNNATLSATEDDIIPSTATPQAAAGATTANGQSTASEVTVLDGTGTAKDAFLNFLVDDADHDVGSTATNLVVSGTITIAWVLLGDY